MPKVAVIMGSRSDFETMKDAITTLQDFGIDVISKIVSAHRTPDLMMQFARNADKDGIDVIIAGAGGSAHLPGMTASYTTLPVIGVPVPSRHLNGVDSLYSIVQMPAGVPVATVGIGNSKNAALLAIRILSIKHEDIKSKLGTFMNDQTDSVLKDKL
ncbi:MAG: 5-(carboxyamino)imidazole ribonucleotide mutase [Candidatus Thermoplasmatota archaeon]|nr:5-(carboxyamino)imidazole ribonucleotide mutase [Candidatus Thermoplasmatota archaeon]